MSVATSASLSPSRSLSPQLAEDSIEGECLSDNVLISMNTQMSMGMQVLKGQVRRLEREFEAAIAREKQHRVELEAAHFNQITETEQQLAMAQQQVCMHKRGIMRRTHFMHRRSATKH